MGLDIQWASKLTKVTCAISGEDEWSEPPPETDVDEGLPDLPALEFDEDFEIEDGCDHLHVYVNPHFPGRAAPLEDGCYTAQDYGGFYFGAYSYYNQWREALARGVAGVMDIEELWRTPDAFRDRPFFELLNFSDCQGTLGANVCAQLARDFQEFDSVAQARLSGFDYQRYSELRHAFGMGANGGMVTFQ